MPGPITIFDSFGVFYCGLFYFLFLVLLYSLPLSLTFQRVLTWLPFIYGSTSWWTHYRTMATKYTSDSITHYVFIFHVYWRQCVCNHVCNSNLTARYIYIYIDISAIYIRFVEAAYWNWIGESTERAGPFSKMQPNKRANKRARAPYDNNFICSTLSRDNALVIIHIFFQFMLSSVALRFIPHFLFCLSFFSFVAFRHCFSFVAVLSTSFSRMTFQKKMLCSFALHNKIYCVIRSEVN